MSEDKYKVSVTGNQPLESITSAAHVVVKMVDEKTLQLTAYVQPPGDHQLYHLIGRVAAQWAHFEHILDTLIWQMAGLHSDTGSCITGQMIGYAPRLKAIIAMARKYGLDARLIEAANKLMTTTYEVSEQRNRIVHDAWFVERSAGAAHQFRSFSFKGGRYGLHEIDSAEIDKTLERIARRITTAHQLSGQILAAVPPLQSRSLQLQSTSLSETAQESDASKAPSDPLKPSPGSQ